jgi:hypothetical protein
VSKQAKLLDTTEAVFHVPAGMLDDLGQRTYEAGVKHAGDIEFRLRRGVRVYHKELGDNLDRPEMKKRRQQIQSNAAAQFWTDIENAVPRLLEVVAAPETLGPKAQWYKTVWGQSVWRAACAAYERACQHDTPRQIRACALGWNAVFGTPNGQVEVESEEEVEA